MQTALLLTLASNLLAADVVIRIDKPTTNVTIITITLPEVQQVQIVTNVVPSAVRTRALPEPPDARASLPRPVILPPMPPVYRPLPGGTNAAYRDHVRATAAKASRGLRRSE